MQRRKAKGDIVSTKPTANERLQRRIRVDWSQSTPSHRSAPEKGRDHHSFKASNRVRCAALACTLDRQMAQDPYLCAAVVRIGLGSLPTALPESSGRVSVRTVNRAHAVPPIKIAPTQAKISRHSNDGTPNWDIANTT